MIVQQLALLLACELFMVLLMQRLLTTLVLSVIKSVKSIFSYTYNKIVVNPKQVNKNDT